MRWRRLFWICRLVTRKPSSLNWHTAAYHSWLCWLHSTTLSCRRLVRCADNQGNVRIILYSVLSIMLEYIRQSIKSQMSIDPLQLHIKTDMLKIAQQLICIDMLYLLIRIVHHIPLSQSIFVLIQYIHPHLAFSILCSRTLEQRICKNAEVNLNRRARDLEACAIIHWMKILLDTEDCNQLYCLSFVKSYRASSRKSACFFWSFQHLTWLFWLKSDGSASTRDKSLWQSGTKNCFRWTNTRTEGPAAESEGCS